MDNKYNPYSQLEQEEKGVNTANSQQAFPAQVYPSSQQEYTPQDYSQPAYTPQVAAFPSQPVQPAYPAQPTYPPQGYPHQYGYPQQPGYPQQFPVQTVPLQQVYTQGNATVFVTDDPLLDAIPFIPTSAPISIQLGNTPKYMLTAVTRPKVETFSGLKMNASWSIVWFFLAIQIIVQILISIAVFEMTKRELEDAGIENLWYATLGGLILVEVILTPLSFFFFTGGICVISRCLAGNRPELVSHPTFLQYCYLYILFNFPLDILSAILSMIPVIGVIFNIAIWIYRIVLNILSMRAVYHLTTGQAIGVILLFILIVVVALVLVGVIFGVAMLTLVEGISAGQQS